jgi:hypothetical protein
VKSVLSAAEGRAGAALLALEQRDALDVVRLGEHVDRRHALQRPARLA